jgi:hypothetical protein
MLHLIILVLIVLAVIHSVRYHRAMRRSMQAQADLFYRLSDECGRLADQMEKGQRR